MTSEAYSTADIVNPTGFYTRTQFIQPLKERNVPEVGYELSLEGAFAADLVKSMQPKKSQEEKLT